MLHGQAPDEGQSAKEAYDPCHHRAANIARHSPALTTFPEQGREQTHGKRTGDIDEACAPEACPKQDGVGLVGGLAQHRAKPAHKKGKEIA
jgi:hypothetical protein